jgi:hypothetical protein
VAKRLEGKSAFAPEGLELAGLPVTNLVLFAEK